jgi:hypothetical protein
MYTLTYEHEIIQIDLKGIPKGDRKRMVESIESTLSTHPKIF